LTGSIILLAAAVIPLVTGLPSEVLGAIETSPLFVKAVWVGVIVFLLYKKYTLTALVLVALGLIVRYEVFGSFVYSQEGILAKYAAEQRRDPRFNKSVDLDLQIGEGTLVRDPARWLDSGRPPTKLLLFPPSEEQLKKVGGW
jgi:hypothetical protein